MAAVFVSSGAGVVDARSYSSVMGQDWKKVFTLMRNMEDPVAEKLMTWIYTTETDLPVDAVKLMAFVQKTPHWPRLHVFRKKIETTIGTSIQNNDLRPYVAADWFIRHPPKNYQGIKVQMDTLISLGLKDKAWKVMEKTWPSIRLERNETAPLVSKYKNYISPETHIKRLDLLLWRGRYTEAKTMMAFVGKDYRALASARMALAKRSGRVDRLIKTVPDYLQNNEGLLYERARWRRRKDRDEAAMEIIDRLPAAMAEPKKWWRERHILARRAMEEGRFDRAYHIVKGHGLEKGSAKYAEAEWLRGWLALRFMDKPAIGYLAFENLYQNVKSAISRSRAAYWSGRAAEKLNDKEMSQKWYRVGALFLSTYYGQLSYHAIYNTPDMGRYAESPLTEKSVSSFEEMDLVRAVRILHKAELNDQMDYFLAKLIERSKEVEDFQLAAQLAREVGRTHYAVRANKKLQQKRGAFLLMDGYPVLNKLPKVKSEDGLVHAIIYRESMFNAKVVSHAGARGLMQLMPATARQVSKWKKQRYRKARLTHDPAYNVLLGATYLDHLLKKYDGAAPLAIAAYNGGPRNVGKWLNIFGHPFKGERDVIDWVEMIPNYETRNYVQRVMETWYMYNLRAYKTPVTILDVVVNK